MRKTFQKIVDEVDKIVLGKQEQIKLALTCLFAKGHLLIEDIPGIGKTTLAKVLAKTLGLDFKRVQFTNDMLPGDILGFSIFDKNSGGFIFHPGPVFTQVLLADEINRATPKTQSALLEAMEEHQVTLEGKTKKLAEPFFVIATQNPVELAGTFPLPESQLDRFLMRIAIGYPNRKAENDLLKGMPPQYKIPEIQTCLTPEEVISIQNNIEKVHASDSLIEYLQNIIDFSRTTHHFLVGLSPRAAMALLSASKSWAYLNDRDYVIPEDLQHVMPNVIRHRIRSKDDLSEIPPEQLKNIMKEVAVP